MSVIFILIGISICMATSFLVSFLWAVNDNQYDDDFTPAVRMLFDDKKSETPLTSDHEQR